LGFGLGPQNPKPQSPIPQSPIYKNLKNKKKINKFKKILYIAHKNI